MSILLKLLIRLDVNFSFLLLFLIIICLLFWMNSLAIKILTVKEAWSEEYYNSGRIEWLSISIELSQRKKRLITEFESLSLLE